MIFEFSGLPFEITFRYPECEEYFLPFQSSKTQVPLASVAATDADLEDAVQYCRASAGIAGVELAALRRRFADILIRNARCLFHGSAMLWKGKVIIFTAPSGTGKTTQTRLWLERYPEETGILNGDKPILQLLENGEILVHPSPWQGKENFGKIQEAVPLHTIVYLRQAPENRLSRMSAAQAVLPLFSQFFCTERTEELYRKNAAVLERMLKTTPVFLLENRGDMESVELLHDALV